MCYLLELRCDIQLPDATNLTTLNSTGPNTPYILFVDRETGKILKYESYVEHAGVYVRVLVLCAPLAEWTGGWRCSR